MLKKKMYALLMAVVLIFTGTLTAFAAEMDVHDSVAPIVTDDKNGVEQNKDVPGSTEISEEKPLTGDTVEDNTVESKGNVDNVDKTIDEAEKESVVDEDQSPTNDPIINEEPTPTVGPILDEDPMPTEEPEQQEDLDKQNEYYEEQVPFDNQTSEEGSEFVIPENEISEVDGNEVYYADSAEPEIYSDANLSIYYSHAVFNKYYNNRIDFYFTVLNYTSVPIVIQAPALAINGETFNVLMSDEIAARSYGYIVASCTIDTASFDRDVFLNVKKISGIFSIINSNNWSDSYKAIFRNIKVGDGSYSDITPREPMGILYQDSVVDIYFLRTEPYAYSDNGLQTVFRIKNKTNLCILIQCRSLAINGKNVGSILMSDPVAPNSYGNVYAKCNNTSGSYTQFLNVNTITANLRVINYTDFSDAYSVAIVDKSPDEERRKQIEGFVSRLYSKILGRATDADGLSYYTQILMNKSASGSEIAFNFSNSPEFKNKNYSDDRYIEILYQAFMGRNSDANGKNYWKNMLANGVSREKVFKGFAESNEFSNICTNYGIERGNINLKDNRDQNAQLTMFVYRLYDKALGRKPEVDGLNFHTGEILAKRVTPIQTAQNFIFSPEFKNKNLNNADYVKVLYRTFMGREYDQSGLDYHLNRMSGGTSREDILLGFAYSPEFKAIMAEFGL